MKTLKGICLIALSLFMAAYVALAAENPNIYDPGELKPRDSATTLAVGDKAPEFELPSLSGETVALARYKGKKRVLLSFVPAAWTPVCSSQWPMYDAARGYFAEKGIVLLGITVDNIPTLHAWTRAIDQDGDGLSFPVLSDFHPHGEVANRYGVLRTSGVSERALFLISEEGLIDYIEIFDINRLPSFQRLERAIEGGK